MSERVADTPDWLRICDRIRDDGRDRGFEDLGPIERTIYLCDNFNFERENGGLSQFFYNSDCSRVFAYATAKALREIGALRTAEVLTQAATIFAHPPDGALGSTWGEYLASVDAEDRLCGLERQLLVAGEDAFCLLEAFVVRHQRGLCPDARDGG